MNIQPIINLLIAGGIIYLILFLMVFITTFVFIIIRIKNLLK